MSRAEFADLLTGEGDPRGEFIALQCRLAATPDDEARRKLRIAENKLQLTLVATGLGDPGEEGTASRPKDTNRPARSSSRIRPHARPPRSLERRQDDRPRLTGPTRRGKRLGMTRLLAPLSLLLTLLACSPTSPCNATTCQGCCDPSGVCKTGDVDSSCGSGGLNCNVCSGGQRCTERVCKIPPVVDAGTEVDAGTMLCGRSPVVCSDQAIQRLGLFQTPNGAPLTNTRSGATFFTEIDASAGGSTPTMSFVYAKFTPTGLEQVNLSDEAALDSFDWDIAFRRFVIRLNGGDSGSSCTTATVVPDTQTFDAITAPAATARWDKDDFLSDDCLMFRDDGFGLMTSPLTAMSPFYDYAGCVRMTNRNFIIRTRGGSLVKLTVQRFYETEAQQTFCNDMRMMQAGARGGFFKVKWAFLN